MEIGVVISIHFQESIFANVETAEAEVYIFPLILKELNSTIIFLKSLDQQLTTTQKRTWKAFYTCSAV